MAKQVQRAIGWVAAFLLAVGMLFLPVSKAYAGPVSGGSPGSGEMRGVWVSYLDWNGWAKDEGNSNIGCCNHCTIFHNQGK